MLPDGTVVPAEASQVSWDGRWQIETNLFDGTVRVSTVFMSLDHQFGDGPPLVFETMVFGGDQDEFQYRYSTKKQAENGHYQVVDCLAAGVEIEIDPDLDINWLGRRPITAPWRQW